MLVAVEFWAWGRQARCGTAGTDNRSNRCCRGSKSCTARIRTTTSSTATQPQQPHSAHVKKNSNNTPDTHNISISISTRNTASTRPKCSCAGATGRASVSKNRAEPGRATAVRAQRPRGVCTAQRGSGIYRCCCCRPPQWGSTAPWTETRRQGGHGQQHRHLLLPIRSRRPLRAAASGGSR